MVTAAKANRKKLPRGMTPWKPGQSGNPTGRSKYELDFKELCRNLSIENAFPILVDYVSGIRRMVGWTRNEQGKLIHTDNPADVVTVACEEATQLKACQFVVERAFGKAPQAVNIGGSDGGELTVHVVVKDVIAETLRGRNDRKS